MKRVVAGLFVLIALALAWRFGPLARWAEPDRLVAAVRAVRASPLALFVGVPVAYVVLGLLMFPVNALRLVTVVALGPWLGSAVALVGTMASALVGHALGGALGRARLERHAGERVRAAANALRRGGALGVAAARVVPLGPFAVVNLTAGAVGVPLRAFTLGTLLAMTPGMLVMALVGVGVHELA